MLHHVRSLHRRRGVRQLVKFCLVGASSLVIDKGTLWLLLTRGMPRAPWWVSATVSFTLAVTNGFVWNRRWTFRARQHGRRRTQYGMFFGTNVVGLGINLALTHALLVGLGGHLPDLGGTPGASDVLVASILAVPVVMLWNFAASKYWTFRPGRAGAVSALVGTPAAGACAAVDRAAGPLPRRSSPR